MTRKDGSHHRSLEERHSFLVMQRQKFDIWHNHRLRDFQPSSPQRLEAEKALDFLNNFHNKYTIYRNDGTLLINKPAGIATQKSGDSHPFGITELTQLALENPDVHPVHRLDIDTSGILAFGEDRNTRASLSKQFAQKKEDTKKIYLAIVVDDYNQAIAGIIAPLARTNTTPQKTLVNLDDGQPAGTAVHKIATMTTEQEIRFSLISARIFTGRTHQIRAHLYDLGYPVAGDRLYFNDTQENLSATRSLLHAYELTLWIPRKDRRNRENLVTFHAPIPNDFQDFIKSDENTIEVIDPIMFHQLFNSRNDIDTK